MTFGFFEVTIAFVGLKVWIALKKEYQKLYSIGTD